MGQIQPTREIKKGEGAWVTEVFTDPATGKTLKVTSYTKEQLDFMQANIEKDFNAKLTALAEMKNLLN